MASRGGRKAEYLKRKERCLASGLCMACGQPKGNAEGGCAGCLEKKRRNRQRRADQRAAVGLCPCGQPPVIGSKLCVTCQTNSRNTMARRRARNVAAGFCFCGQASIPGQRACAECNAKATKSTMKRYRANIIAKVCAFCSGELNDKTFRCDQCNGEHVKRTREVWRQRRSQVIEQYGSKCVCCEETTPEFLELDHINNDGNEHRRELNTRHFYAWVIKANYPSDLQLLCANCNSSKGKFGGCQHKTEPTDHTNKHLRRKRRQRHQMIARYGGECRCCNEKRWTFLEFDHVLGGGRAHRRELKAAGTRLFTWIKANGYPDSIQLLCSNCNRAKGHYGCCPHQPKSDEIVPTS